MAEGAPLYLDHHATTPVDERVVEAMAPWWRERFGNAASHTHRYGWEAEAGVELARESLAEALGSDDPREIVFTSGATESNNIALAGAVAPGEHLVTVVTEHPAVLDPCAALEASGVRVTRLGVAGDGLLDPAAVAGAIGDDTALVSVMAANNEIGVLQPLAEIAGVCAERGVLLHTDAAQAVGKIPFDAGALGVDLVSLCAHKLYGPKGVGALLVRRRRRDGRRIRLRPLLHGGGHERGLRPGTLPVPLVVGLGRAVALCLAEREQEAERLGGLRDRLLSRLRDELGGVELNGHAERRLPGNLNVAFEGIEADALIAETPEIAMSTGSACSSAHPEPSHVLRALGLPDARIRASVRLGLGRGTTAEAVETAAGVLVERVRKLRSVR